MDTNLHVLPRTELARSEWNQVVDACSEGWLWHRWEFQEALSEWHGREDLTMAAVNGAGEILALLPLHAIGARRPPIGRVQLESMGGIAAADGLPSRSLRKVHDLLLAQLFDLARSRRARQTVLRLSPLAPAYREPPRTNPLLSLGCRDASGITWMVPLEGHGEQELWARLEGRSRTEIRKACKAGMVVRPAGADDLGTYYHLHRENYLRNGLPPHPEAYFERIWRDFIGAGLARCWIAELDGTPVAAQNFAWYKGAAWYWTGASSEGGLRSGAARLLQWRAMQQMVEDGLQAYETGQACLDRNAGKAYDLSEFKRSIGGELYPFYAGQWDHPRQADVVRAALKRSLRRRRPSSKG